MDLQLQDKVVLVAASSGGLGFGIAEAVAREGARVVMGSRSKENIERAADSIRKSTGAEVRSFPLDVSDSASISNWVASAIGEFGSIDGLVVNGGGPKPGKFDDCDDDAWMAGYELTLMSAVRMIRAALPTMRKQQSGSILVSTSTSVKEPIDVLLLSNVFRSGVVSLVKSLADDLAGEGIRINNLVPGRIDTERVQTIDQLNAKKLGISHEQRRDQEQALIPIKRYGTAEEYGKAAAFLLSNAAAYITGSTVTVDGGKSRTVW